MTGDERSAPRGRGYVRGGDRGRRPGLKGPQAGRARIRAVLAGVAIVLAATGCFPGDWTDPDARHYARKEWAARDTALRRGAGAVERFESRYGPAWIAVLATGRDVAGRRCGRYRIEWPDPYSDGATIRQERTACERADGRWREE
ncbi:MAG: hypothetical protein OXH79_20035 [Boseongicola sp.]|nr:hypothetical protein [Boseongicola sp.]